MVDQESIMSRLTISTIFTAIDLTKRFFQVPAYKGPENLRFSYNLNHESKLAEIS